MRYVTMLTLLLTTTASAALAQSGAPVSLDEQMRRLQKSSANTNSSGSSDHQGFTVTEPAAPATTSAEPRKSFTSTTTKKPLAPTSGAPGTPITPSAIRPSGPASAAPQPAADAPAVAAPGNSGAAITGDMSRRGEVIDSVGSGAIPALPLELMTENGISYLSGGIGDEEIAQIEAQQNQFNIHLTITNDSGDFASNVVTVLKDVNGKTLITVKDAGPKLLVRVPAGRYTVETAAHGATVKLSLNAPAKGAVKSQIRI